MILLDTNVLLWLFMGDTRLSETLRGKIEKVPSSYFVSVISLWEIATKRSIGKLELNVNIVQAIQEAGFVRLSLTDEHVQQYEQLPLLHRDPFDRMLVAQALTENIPLASSDMFLRDYGVITIPSKSD